MDSQVTYDNALELDPETKGESWKGFNRRSDMISLALEKDPSGPMTGASDREA